MIKSLFYRHSIHILIAKFFNLNCHISGIILLLNFCSVKNFILTYKLTIIENVPEWITNWPKKKRDFHPSIIRLIAFRLWV